MTKALSLSPLPTKRIALATHFAQTHLINHFDFHIVEENEQKTFSKTNNDYKTVQTLKTTQLLIEAALGKC